MLRTSTSSAVKPDARRAASKKQSNRKIHSKVRKVVNSRTTSLHSQSTFAPKLPTSLSSSLSPTSSILSPISFRLQPLSTSTSFEPKFTSPTSLSTSLPYHATHPQSPTKRFIAIRTTSVSSNQLTPPSTPLTIPTNRPFSSQPQHSDSEDHDHGAFERKPPSDPSQAMTITIVDREGTSHNMPCKVGDNVLQLMRIFQEKNPKLYLEGACESSLACSTCHIILDDKSYNLLQQIKESTEEEEDLLDMASCLTPTSRLGCQINLVKGMDGSTISLPKFSRNFYVDGHVPQPH